MIKKFLILCTALALLLLYVGYDYVANGPLIEQTNIIIPKGTGFQGAVELLAEKGVIAHPLFFKIIGAATGQGRKFKAGEYSFPAASSPQEVMDMVASGKVVIHKITVAEGLSVRDITKLLIAEPVLAGDMPVVPEGTLLPETYQFIYGDTRTDVVKRMQVAMSKTLDDLWAKRKAGLPFQTPQEALTLASIVEKETGLPQERPRVAAVFINRLRLGMKLQSDPTTAYGLGRESGAGLTLADLQSNTPYNTYVIDGLPPTPIANPGRASIEAVLNPPDTKELYFVATGNGGHNFAATLQEHNENVAKYRAVIKR